MLMVFGVVWGLVRLVAVAVAVVVRLCLEWRHAGAFRSI